MAERTLVVGGGMAGLTAAAYLRRAGREVSVLEKEGKVGGLVTSFRRDGFTWDGGIRAVENSGIVQPMLRQLGITLEFLPSGVSIGFGAELLRLGSRDSLDEYRGLLTRIFPGNAAEIRAIAGRISTIMDYMDVLYGIDNPLFLDLGADRDYLVHTILPWMLKYLLTMPKVARLKLPVDEYLSELTKNRALVDLLAQHFFRKTPTFFALSYFGLYLDYRYPKGGTGSLPRALESYIAAKGGEIHTGVRAESIDPVARVLRGSDGVERRYDSLVWAADLKSLYRAVDPAGLRGRERSRFDAMAALVAPGRGGDSVLTVYVEAGLDPSYFQARTSPHLFYTPSLEGLSAMDLAGLEAWSRGAAGSSPEGRDEIFARVARYLDLNTFEISIPALRDPSLAPPGKTGLIVSALFDYEVAKRIRDEGWYEEFEKMASERIVGILDGSVFPGLRAATEGLFASTPLTLERLTGNSEGAITGWAFTNDVIPAVHDLPRVARSVLTPVSGIYQAGQWSFSPSGLPISILTGKLAADAILRARGGRA